MNRIVIFANGILNQRERLRARLRPTDRIFCADGGTRHALALGLTPEVIVGDLDSLAPETVLQMETAGVTIHRHPADKDYTDLELALELAVSEKPDEILLVTALGGRLDQTLGNLLLLTRQEYASVRLTVADGPQWATLLRGPKAVTISGQPGDTLSLIPLTVTVEGVDITGVKWPLVNATLSLGSTLTISNALAEQQATVNIGEGMVLLIHFDKTFEEAENEINKK
jgi:thiamine pyrophosphokinase